ncbi:hypothetical protein OG21DRAFT_1607290 [Imleria badia]|nr:hypothetical protein OG21DRAFT_1607290 [Imleria badia]
MDLGIPALWHQTRGPRGLYTKPGQLRTTSERRRCGSPSALEKEDVWVITLSWSSASVKASRREDHMARFCVGRKKAKRSPGRMEHCMVEFLELVGDRTLLGSTIDVTKRNTYGRAALSSNLTSYITTQLMILMVVGKCEGKANTQASLMLHDLTVPFTQVGKAKGIECKGALVDRLITVHRSGYLWE